MNDNVFKLIMVYALIAWNAAAIESGEASSATILALVGLVFALPFLLIVPIAGNFADKFSKQSMIVKLKVVEFIVMAFGITALYLESSMMLYVTMFLMSSQSAFFGPCKLGIIPEMVDSERLSKANGSIQLFTFLAIISGTVLAPELSLLTHENFSLAASVCLIIAGLGLAASLQIKPTPAHPDRHLSLNGFGSVFKTFLEIRKDGFLTLAVLALAVFSLAAAFIQLNVLDFGAQHLNLSPEQATRLFLLTAIGIGVGSTTAGWLSGRGIEFGIVPVHRRLAQWSWDRVRHRAVGCTADEPEPRSIGHARRGQHLALGGQHGRARIRSRTFYCATPSIYSIPQPQRPSGCDPSNQRLHELARNPNCKRTDLRQLISVRRYCAEWFLYARMWHFGARTLQPLGAARLLC